MNRCPHQDFQRHPDDAVADIGSGGGAEMTVGSCSNCGAILIHCWVGGVAEAVHQVDQETVDRLLAVDLAERRPVLKEWYESRQ